MNNPVTHTTALDPVRSLVAKWRAEGKKDFDDPHSEPRNEYGRAKLLCADELEAALPAPERGEVTDEMVERLAKYIYQQEASKCSTLDESLRYQSHWPRAIPEARAMLTAAMRNEHD